MCMLLILIRCSVVGGYAAVILVFICIIYNFFVFTPFVSSWGRWHDILSHARCKRRLGEKDVETICRVILVFCLLHYRGDENIKSFIWELITPPENGQEPNTLLNHSGMIFNYFLKPQTVSKVTFRLVEQA